MGGIYIIRNKINNHFYLGRTDNFKQRKREHWINFKKGDKNNSAICDAVKSYGIENFVFEPVLLIEKFENQIKWEQMFLDCKFKEGQNVCHYNLSDSAHGGSYTEESRKKNSEKVKSAWKRPEYIEKQKKFNNSNRKREILTENQQKMLNDKKLKNKWRKKISESRKHKSLSNEDLKNIFNMLDENFMQKDIMEKYNISFGVMKNIKEGNYRKGFPAYDKIIKKNFGKNNVLYKYINVEIIESIIKDRKNGFTYKQICSKYEIGETVLKRLRKENNF